MTTRIIFWAEYHRGYTVSDWTGKKHDLGCYRKNFLAKEERDAHISDEGHARIQRGQFFDNGFQFKGEIEAAMQYMRDGNCEDALHALMATRKLDGLPDDVAEARAAKAVR
jgi:hypothetical protein